MLEYRRPTRHCSGQWSVMRHGLLGVCHLLQELQNAELGSLCGVPHLASHCQVPRRLARTRNSARSMRRPACGTGRLWRSG